MAPLVTADDLADALGMATPAADPELVTVADAADTWLVQYLKRTDADGTPIDHSQHAYCKRAALELSVELWQSATAAGGQPVSVEFAPTPYQLGLSLLRKVSGAIAPCRDTASMVG